MVTRFRPGNTRRRGRPRFYTRRRVCAFCVEHISEIDYKDISRMRRYVSEKGPHRAPAQDGQLRQAPESGSPLPSSEQGIWRWSHSFRATHAWKGRHKFSASAPPTLDTAGAYIPPVTP